MRLESVTKRCCLLLLVSSPAICAEIVGTVGLEGMSPRLQEIEVELDCGGTTARTIADSQGRFRFARPADVSGCRVRASTTRHVTAEAAVSKLPKQAQIPGLVLQRAGKWQGDAVSVTSLTAPAEARELLSRAVAAMRSSDYRTAETSLELAVEAYRDYAEAWFELGRLRLARNDFDGARASFDASLEADPWFVSPYEPLLLLLSAEQNWERVRELSTQLLHMNPNLPAAHYRRGLASYRLGHNDVAEQAIEAIESRPDSGGFAGLYHLRGLLRVGEDRAAALADFRRYLELEPDGPAANEVRRELSR